MPLSIVALQHPDLAAKQLEHTVKDLGHRGAMVTAALDGVELSDERFHPFWATAEELDVPIFIHPRHFREGAPRFKGQGFLSNIIGNPLDTTVALAHLIYEGTLDEFPNLKIMAAHGGGFLASYIGRFDHGHNSGDRGGRGAEKRAPSEYLKQIYFDTVVFGTENLHHIIRECGAGQLVLGTDYPAGMGNINPIAHLLSVEGLSAGDIEAVLGGTVKKIAENINFAGVQHEEKPIRVRDGQQWIYDYVLKASGRAVHYEYDLRDMPKQAKSIRMVSKYLVKEAEHSEKLARSADKAGDTINARKLYQHAAEHYKEAQHFFIPPTDPKRWAILKRAHACAHSSFNLADYKVELSGNPLSRYYDPWRSPSGTRDRADSTVLFIRNGQH